MTTASSEHYSHQDHPPPRFSWPMRIFLFVLIFDMVFRSLTTLLPIDEWRKEYSLTSYPRRFPTRAEIEELSKQPIDEDGFNPLTEEWMLCFDSVWDFLKPWPSRASRKEIGDWYDGVKYSTCWLNTRLEFLESLVGIHQSWQMFSPNVSRWKYVTRARLIYKDKTTRIIRNHADPEDLTNYSHWFMEKILDYELCATEGDSYGCFGYCNLLAHRYSTNEAGSPLVEIQLFSVWYRLAPPDVNPVEFYRRQNGPPESQVNKVFYRVSIKHQDGQVVLEE